MPDRIREERCVMKKREWLRCVVPGCKIGGMADKMYVPDLAARRRANHGERVPSHKIGAWAICLSHAKRLKAESGAGYDLLALALEAARNTERDGAEATAKTEADFQVFAARFVKPELQKSGGVVIQIRPGWRQTEEPEQLPAAGKASENS